MSHVGRIDYLGAWWAGLVSNSHSLRRCCTSMSRCAITFYCAPSFGSSEQAYPGFNNIAKTNASKDKAQASSRATILQLLTASRGGRRQDARAGQANPLRTTSSSAHMSVLLPYVYSRRVLLKQWTHVSTLPYDTSYTTQHNSGRIPQPAHATTTAVVSSALSYSSMSRKVSFVTPASPADVQPHALCIENVGVTSPAVGMVMVDRDCPLLATRPSSAD